MAWTQQGIPFAPRSHTSFKAAESVAARRGEKLRRLLRAYHEAGDQGLTDAEAAVAIGVPVQSVCSLRNAAIDCDLVYRDGERMGSYGKAVGVYKAKPRES